MEERATTFINHHVNNHLEVVRLQPDPNDPLRRFNVTAYSSCEGLVAFLENDTSRLYVGKLSIPPRRRLITDPPSRSLPCSGDGRDDMHVVLAAVRQPQPQFLVVCASRTDVGYSFDTYNSLSGRWRTHDDGGRYCFRPFQEINIVPHSGVSCGLDCFWLVTYSPTETTPFAVLSFEFENRGRWEPIPSLRWSYLSQLEMPTDVLVRHRDGPFQLRMQLGRAMGALGLVAVNQATYTIQLFTLKVLRPVTWERLELFNVQVVPPADGAWVATWRPEDKTLLCREMPRPIRFDSFNVELLFWVHGRVLLLENSPMEPHAYQMEVLPGHWPDSITDGHPCRGDATFELASHLL